MPPRKRKLAEQSANPATKSSLWDHYRTRLPDRRTVNTPSVRSRSRVDLSDFFFDFDDRKRRLYRLMLRKK
jgi:hypothetical protein